MNPNLNLEIGLQTAPETILRLEDAAKILGYHQAVLARKFKSKQIPGWKKGKYWFTFHSELINYIKS
jgi:DNA-binding LacI/PurR family transcriptional regulator